MKSPRLLAFLFILLFAPTIQAEKPLMVESVWGVANLQVLMELLSRAYGLDKDTLEFPDEINSNAPWLGGTITDGNEVWTIMVLSLKDDAQPLEGFGAEFLFRIKLRSHAIIAGVFPDGVFQMQVRRSRLILFSPGTDAAGAENILAFHLNFLVRRSPFAFIQYYPERTLLPTLPPEQEDEGAFIKRVRERSAKSYQEGQYAGTVGSHFLGIHVEEHGIRVICEEVNADESSLSSDTEPLPFQFGGFVNPDAAIGAAFRIEREHIEKLPIGIKFGVKITPPEERPNEKQKSNLIISFMLASDTLSSDSEERDDWHMIKGDNNIYVFYPKQPENRPEEEDVLSNEVLDKLNEKFVRSLLKIGSNIRQPLSSEDWKQPTDFACLMDYEALYVGFSYPSDKMAIDWDFLAELGNFWNDYIRQVDSEWAELIMGSEVKTVGEPVTTAGVTYHWILLDCIPLIVGYAPEHIYAAVGLLIDTDKVSEELVTEQFNTLHERLVQKVNDSRQAVAEKMEVPTTVFHSKMEEHTFRLDRESLGYGVRYTAHIENDSIFTALALIANYGGDFLKQMIPFLPGE